MSSLPKQASWALRATVGVPLIAVLLLLAVVLLAGCASDETPASQTEFAQDLRERNAEELTTRPPRIELPEESEEAETGSEPAPTSSTTAQPPPDCAEPLDLVIDVANAIVLGTITEAEAAEVVSDERPECLDQFTDALTARLERLEGSDLEAFILEQKAETEQQERRQPSASSGTVLVGSEIEPGLYRVTPEPSVNTFAYCATLDSDLNINDNALDQGNVLCRVKPSDFAFEWTGWVERIEE